MRRLALLLPIITLTLTSLACNTILPPRPEVVWDTDPTALIVRYDTCCGMLYDPNGIPTYQLWGDGRMLWVSTDSNNVRHVYTATLTPDQMKALLQKFVDDGFFGLRDSYGPNYQVYDAPSTCLSLTLTSLSKNVCDLMGNAPDKFYELADALTAGVAGSDYIPPRAFLQASPTNYAGTQALFQWPAQS